MTFVPAESIEREFNHDNTPEGMKTPEGQAKVAQALENWQNKDDTAKRECFGLLDRWGSDLQQVIRTSDIPEMGNDLDNAINAVKEARRAQHKLFLAASGRK